MRLKATTNLLPLPENEAPSYRCVEMEIPDSDDWLELIVSVLSVGETWLNYEKDEFKRGTEIAQEFRRFINKFLEATDCQNCVDMTVSIDNLGLIFAFPASAIPQGAIFCVGQAFTIDEKPDLVAKAKAEGWEGFEPANEFHEDRYRLPNLRGRMIYGTYSGGGVGLLDTGGSETVTLTTAQMPEHGHNFRASSSIGSNINNIARGGVLADEAGAVLTAGGGEPHDNMPPYVQLIWCMFVDKVDYQNTYDYSVTADDCKLYENNNGSQSLIVDINQCAAETIDNRERVNPEDTDNSIVSDLDCVYGAAEKVANYLIDNALSLLEVVEAGANFIDSIFDTFPDLVGTFVKQLVGVLSDLIIPLAISELNDVDNRTSVACDLFCVLIAQDDPMRFDAQTIDNWMANYSLATPSTPNMILPFAAKNDGYTVLVRRYYLGFDECNNDWQLCSCVDLVTLIVPGVEDGYSSADNTLLNGVRYAVSVSGVVERSGSARDDGWFAWSSDDPIVKNRITGTTNQSCRLKLSGTVDVSLIELYTPIQYSSEGYSFTIVGQGAVPEAKYQDTVYTDNGGSIVVRFARALP